MIQHCTKCIGALAPMERLYVHLQKSIYYYYYYISFANNHGLVYNEQKTKFMCLKPAGLKNIYVPNVELNGKNTGVS